MFRKKNSNFFKVEQIVNECLLVYQETKPEVWFERAGQDTLFLSTAIQTCNNPEGDKRFLPIAKWFREKLLVIRSPFHPAYSINTLKAESEQRQKILDLITSSDTGIIDIPIDTRKKPAHRVQVNPQEHKIEVQQGLQEVNEPEFIHKHPHHGKEKFNVSDESQGTLQLLSLAGPIMDILEKGRVLVIDEFDTHLHPLLAHRLVKMFHDPEKNKNNAQLIFVTHNVLLLSKKILDTDDLFRRDQIWFVEKNFQTQESTLYSLSDFESHDKSKSRDKNECLIRDYLLGCYGAIPFFS